MPPLGFIVNLFVSALILRLVAVSAKSIFDPRNYPRKTATCKAVDRSTGTQSLVDISIHYVELNTNAKDVIIMVHGWPGLWSTWSNQIQEFQTDFHLLVPDLRGFGESTHPGDPNSSGTMGDIVGDLVCILEQAKVKRAICVGHDWGSQVCYEAARMRPDIFSSVVGISVPYIPSAGSFVPVSALTSMVPHLSYQVFLGETPAAATEQLDKDIRRTLRATLRTVESPPPSTFLVDTDSYLRGWDQISEIPPIPFFTQEEEDYLVEQYSHQGFSKTLQFYAPNNRHASWKFDHDQGNFTIHQPVLAIFPLNDPVADWVLAARLLRSNRFLPNSITQTVDGAHWVHLESSEKVNKMMRDWFASLNEKLPAQHAQDEL